MWLDLRKKCYTCINFDNLNDSHAANLACVWLEAFEFRGGLPFITLI